MNLIDLASSLRLPLRVSMKNWIGMTEAGIDGGGIFREFITEVDNWNSSSYIEIPILSKSNVIVAQVVKEALDINRGLFTETKEHLLYPNPLAPLIFHDYK